MVLQLCFTSIRLGTVRHQVLQGHTPSHTHTHSLSWANGPCVNEMGIRVAVWKWRIYIIHNYATAFDWNWWCTLIHIRELTLTQTPAHPYCTEHSHSITVWLQIKHTNAHWHTFTWWQKLPVNCLNSRPAIKSKYFIERVQHEDISFTQEIKCSTHYCVHPVQRARATTHLHWTNEVPNLTQCDTVSLSLVVMKKEDIFCRKCVSEEEVGAFWESLCSRN